MGWNALVLPRRYGAGSLPDLLGFVKLELLQRFGIGMPAEILLVLLGKEALRNSKRLSRNRLALVSRPARPALHQQRCSIPASHHAVPRRCRAIPTDGDGDGDGRRDAAAVPVRHPRQPRGILSHL